MCQACHLAYDIGLHTANAARTRARALIHPDQTALAIGEAPSTPEKAADTPT